MRPAGSFVRLCSAFGLWVSFGKELLGSLPAGILAGNPDNPMGEWQNRRMGQDLSPRRSLSVMAPSPVPPRASGQADADTLCCSILGTAPLSITEAESLARVFKALSDPARLRILTLLAMQPDREACVCALLPHMDIAQPTVSHHLKLLHDAGILTRERRGSWVYYCLVEERLVDISRAVGFLVGPPRTSLAADATREMPQETDVSASCTVL